MGFTDKIKSLFGKKEGGEEKKKPEEKKEAIRQSKPMDEEFVVDENAKYAEHECALCGNLGCDKKWAGQYWHKSCYRHLRKKGKGMVKGM